MSLKVNLISIGAKFNIVLTMTTTTMTTCCDKSIGRIESGDALGLIPGRIAANVNRKGNDGEACLRQVG